MPPAVQTSSQATPRRLVREPVYFQLCEVLRDVIRSGEYQSGQQFLTEREVSKRFHISRVTANKAISHLVVEGLLEFRKGVGTFVLSSALDYDLHSLVSFTRRTERAGKRPRTRVTAYRLCVGTDASPVVRQELNAGNGDPLFYCERVRSADECPIIIERRYLVAAYCSSLTKADLSGSLYSVLTEKFGLRLSGAEQTIRAVELNARNAQILGVRPRSSAFWIHGIGYLEGGNPLWVEDTFYRGDLCAFHNRIGIQGASRPARPDWVKSPAKDKGWIEKKDH